MTGSDVAAGSAGNGSISCSTLDTEGAKHIEGRPSLHPPLDIPYEGGDFAKEVKENRAIVCCVTPRKLTDCTGHGGHPKSVPDPLEPPDHAESARNEPCESHENVKGVILHRAKKAVAPNSRGKTCSRGRYTAYYVPH